MALHRYAGLNEAIDCVDDSCAALELHRLGATLLKQATGVTERVGRVGLVRHKGQVRDDQRLVRAAHNRAGVVDDVVDGHRNRRLVTEHRRSQAVPDEDDR